MNKEGVVGGNQNLYSLPWVSEWVTEKLQTTILIKIEVIYERPAAKF